MEITVAEILRSELLAEAKVIAGADGLIRPVSSVTVGEVPDIADWLKGGEVVLSTLYAVSEDPAAQLEFVSKIIARNAAALLIKPERFVKEVQKTMVKEAEKASFPLIVVPNEIRWTDLVRDIYDSIIRAEVEIRMKSDLIDDLLAGQFKADEIVRRAGFLGADLSGGSIAMFVNIDGFGSAIERMKLDEQAVQRLKREIFNIADWAANTYSRKSLVSLKRDNIIIFLAPVEGADNGIEADAKRVAAEIKDSFANRYKGVTSSVGIGRYYAKPTDLMKTFEESRTALSIGRALGSSDSVTAFDNFGVYKLLLRVYEQAPEDLEALRDETIKPLVDYDAKHKGDLLLTLITFLANNLNLNNTAEQLFTHRHTVRYRLERIAEISGLSVDKSDDLEKLSLGIKASRLLSGLSNVE